MGFVYNNYWEAFCRTYLELNGYFVMSNVFVNLLVPDVVKKQEHAEGMAKPESKRLEADLIAVKPSSSKLKNLNIVLDNLDWIDRKPIGSEFFAGIEDGKEKLIYCEVRAYLQSRRDGFSGFFEDDLTKLKVLRIKERFDRLPDVVLIGNGLSKSTHNKATKTHEQQDGNEQWTCWLKEMSDIFYFIGNRFNRHNEKMGIMYNDPCLEMMRAFFGRQPLADISFRDRSKSK